jgi:hypothetical protein
LAGEALADHGDAGSASEIAGVEIAAAGEVYAVGFVVARSDRVNHRLRLFVGVVVRLIGGLAGDREVDAACAFGGQARSDADFQDTGNGGDAFLELLVDGANLGGC